MQTIATAPQLPGANPYRRGRTQTVRTATGNRPEQAKPRPASGAANDFLRSTFSPLPVLEIDPLFKEVNYRYLYDSARNYAKLLGMALDVEYDPADFGRLHDSFYNLLCGNNNVDNMYLTVEEKRGGLRFRLSYRTWLDCLYFIPAGVVDKVKGKLRTILLEFMRHIVQRHKLSMFFQTPDFDWLEEIVENDDRNEMEEDFLACYRSYTEGAAMKTLKMVDAKPGLSVEELTAMVESYKAVNVKDRMVFESIRGGLPYIQKDCRSVFSYFPYEEDEYGQYPITADRMIVVMYGNDDHMCEWISEALESESNSGSSIPEINKGTIRLTPNTRKAIVHDAYTDDFLSWLNEFIKALQQYD